MTRSANSNRGFTARAVRELGHLAWRDYGFEWRISLCFVLALTAVLAPLMVLFGLKFGVVDTLSERLIQRPETRELVPLGHRSHAPEWLRALAARPEVGFMIPSTRRIAASANLVERADGGAQAAAVQMIPSAVGDPLLEGSVSAPFGLREVVLSAPLARRLNAGIGERLRMHLERRRDGRDEVARAWLNVVGVLDESAMAEDALLVSLQLLVATEDYRDGLAVAGLDWPGDQPDAAAPERSYPRFRLYARSIYAVRALEDWLRGQGVEVVTQGDEVATMQALEANLDRVFWLIAVIGGLGVLASLAASLVANVARKHRELSVARLIGFPAHLLPLFPVFQGAFTALLGGTLAIGLYLPVAAALNSWFADSLRPGEHICRLLPEHLAAALALTLIGAILASLWAGVRAARIEPARGLKDV